MTYEHFCLVDPLFYDSPNVTGTDDVVFPVAAEPVPDGWRRVEMDDWVVYHPNGASLPPQGWKIHVSACLANAEDVLAVVFEYCAARRISFKFVRSRQCLLLRNAKYADRGASGKFVTIYPADEVQLERVLTELGTLLDGQPGPYILSDLRWGDGPLYVRYGGFVERFCVGPNGALDLAIEDATGHLVPDLRGPTFSTPPWVTLPAFLEPHLAARANASLEHLPYRIDSAIHFSNGGGLYVGVDERTGEQVVLKEARPHAGLDTDGCDAVSRLHREREMLVRLAGLDVAPAVRDHFVVGDHHFLVLEFVEGEPLKDVLVATYPLLTDHVQEAEVRTYTEWAVGVIENLERHVAAIHERGVVIGDLHPNNVLVRPDGRLVLIDFEVASAIEEGRRPTLADPGFVAPRTCDGFDVDLYALACLRIFVFLPVTTMFAVDGTKVYDFEAAITDVFPVPDGFLEPAVQRIAAALRVDDAPGSGRTRPTLRTLEPTPEGWNGARASMVRAILASATPARDDRLFPGDPAQFVVGGLNLAYGAAGVLYALAECGVPCQDDHQEWLVQRAIRPEPGARIGLYDGLHGVAFVLDRLGHRAEARKVLEICLDELEGRWDRLGLDLFAGLAGIGLNLAHFGAAYGDPAVTEAASKVAGVVADRLGGVEDVPTTSGGSDPYAGLVRGSSGPALLFVRLFEQSGDAALLDLAATALRQDLRRCLTRSDGIMEVDEGWRTMPYVADGSVGIGMVLDDYLRHRSDEQFAEAAAAIRRAAASGFYIEPGLFYGRAGMIAHLSRTLPSGGAASDPVVAEHVRRLAWHATSYRGDVAFPGDQLLRLSTDLATGAAGVLLALGAAFHDPPAHLPFLGPLDRPPVAVATDLTSNQEGGE